MTSLAYDKNSVNVRSVDSHEFFSLTNKLTYFTFDWNRDAAQQRSMSLGFTSISSYLCTQYKGELLSRVVNLLILPTDLIDAIAHVAMGVLTLLILAPGEAIYNLSKNANERSDRFTVWGGLTNFAYAGKHLLEAVPRAAAGVFSPNTAFRSYETQRQRNARFGIL